MYKSVKKESEYFLYFAKKDKIEYLESDSNYTILHLINGEIERSSYNLRIFEILLQDIPRYTRISRGIIINLKFAKSVEISNNLLYLNEKYIFRISRRRLNNGLISKLLEFNNITIIN